MKKVALICLAFAAVPAFAQTTSDARIRVTKESNGSVTSHITYMPNDSLYIAQARASGEWYMPVNSTTCANVDLGNSADVQMKTDLYNASTMISPDDAKRVALCAIPGQIGSGEMNMTNGRPEYAISVIPNGKRTYSKVIVDAQTGAVLSTKQFGGLRGLTGWARESMEHKTNTP